LAIWETKRPKTLSYQAPTSLLRAPREGPGYFGTMPGNLPGLLTVHLESLRKTTFLL